MITCLPSIYHPHTAIGEVKNAFIDVYTVLTPLSCMSTHFDIRKCCVTRLDVQYTRLDVQYTRFDHWKGCVRLVDLFQTRFDIRKAVWIW